MLKVRVAELVRNSDRGEGVGFNAVFDNFQLSQLISSGGNVTAILEDPDVNFFLKAIASHGYGKILAEPTLVAINGKTASFLAGGEFAVPTTVGIGGVGAAAGSTGTNEGLAGIARLPGSRPRRPSAVFHW